MESVKKNRTVQPDLAETSTIMDKEYRELVQRVKVEEDKHQEMHNTKLELEFVELKGKFRESLISRADLEINQVSSGGDEGGLVSSSRRQFLWNDAEARKSAEVLEDFC
jgi:hypothetical protein